MHSAQMTPIFEGHPPERSTFPIKTRVRYIIYIYIYYIYIHISFKMTSIAFLNLQNGQCLSAVQIRSMIAARVIGRGPRSAWLNSTQPTPDPKVTPPRK